jgi:hypothetical protein
MRGSGGTTALAAAALLVAGAAARAADSPNIDRGAMDALQKMGAYLRSLASFQVLAETTHEDVLDDGQKVQYGGSVNILAHRPNKLRAEVENDRVHRLYLYDGSSFTLFAERVGFYATVAAPPTIGKLVEKLHADYDFEVPLEDLFEWGDKGWQASSIKSAMDVGPGQVAGVTCEQYILRQDDVDWQIWVQLGSYPLPRKMVITTRTDEARPEYSAVLVWNLAPSFNDASFKFQPPDGVTRVVFSKAASAVTAPAAPRTSK